MTIAPGIDEVRSRTFPFPSRHFLSVTDLDVPSVGQLLDLADGFVAVNRQPAQKVDLLKGRTLHNLFFDAPTRTHTSSPLAANPLLAHVITRIPRAPPVTKGEPQ